MQRIALLGASFLLVAVFGLMFWSLLPALLGFVGDSGSPGVVHLHVEVRRAREGVDAGQLPLGQVNQNAKTVACDPRNVLELLP